MSTGYDRTLDRQDLTSLVGRHVYDADGSKVGTAGSFYYSEVSGEPEWVTVKTGLFGAKESFVPLKGAGTAADGLHVAVRKDKVKDAPLIDEDGHLSEAETAELYRHYGLTPGTTMLTSDRTGTGRGSVPPQTGRPAGRPAGQRDSAHAYEDTQRLSVLRSEEQLRAGTESVESGRVRLRKRVVTSQKQITIPVRHEEAHVTREPVRPGEVPAGATMGEEELEVVLHEERPVVTKETVAVERVSLDTRTVQENREVSDTIRHEEVEIDDSKRPRP
jgi:uncharacterized protein (TIGR02271 family)